MAALRFEVPHSFGNQFARYRKEERFVSLCESARLPLPEINATVEGLMVDALWREQRVIVELDGHIAHSTRAQLERDRRREMRLRAAGFIVLRYTWKQVTEEPDLVAADLAAALSARSRVSSARLRGWPDQLSSIARLA